MEPNGRWTGPSYSDGTWIGKGNNLTETNKGTITLYAQWKPYKFKLKFDKNKPGNASHDVSGSMSDQEITYDAQNILYGNRYSLIGWTFTGWKCNGISITNGQELKNLLKSDTDNATFTLYAQWRQNSFTIKFNPDGGCSHNDMTVKYDTDFSLPGCSRSGYRFDGWSPNVGRNYTAVDGAVVWTTAQWTPMEHGISGSSGTSAENAITWHAGGVQDWGSYTHDYVATWSKVGEGKYQYSINNWECGITVTYYNHFTVTIDTFSKTIQLDEAVNNNPRTAIHLEIQEIRWPDGSKSGDKVNGPFVASYTKEV